MVSGRLWVGIESLGQRTQRLVPRNALGPRAWVPTTPHHPHRRDRRHPVDELAGRAIAPCHADGHDQRAPRFRQDRAERADRRRADPADQLRLGSRSRRVPDLHHLTAATRWELRDSPRRPHAIDVNPELTCVREGRHWSLSAAVGHRSTARERPP